MRVKYAFQLLSKTTKAVSKFICDTASFIVKVDTIFDCMNSGSLYGDNLYRSAIQLNSKSFTFIKYILSYLKNVKFIDSKGVHF